MKISKTAIWAIKGMDGDAKRDLAAGMGISLNRLYYWIKVESDNLTKAANMAVLSERLGLTHEQLLETKVQQAAA